MPGTAPIPVYQAIIDELVDETRRHSPLAKRVATDDSLPAAREDSAIHKLVPSLTQDQRIWLSELLMQERSSAIHDTLSVLSWWIECRDVALTVNGHALPADLSGMGMQGDYIGRVDGWTWPDET